MRIGFLFNHDQVHQIAHSLPIAIELAQGGYGHEIIVATTNPRLSAAVSRLARPLIEKGSIQFVQLGLRTRSSRMLSRGLEKVVPATKLLVYRDNLDFFRALDVLVVAEKTSLVLKKRYGLHDLKIVHTRHGAGDRAIGFDKASAGFDLVLAAGAKIRDRLIQDAGVAPERIAVVGYPKFDLVRTRQSLFYANGRPTVLYNPHVSPHLSSWYQSGRRVLDFFVENEDFNLIFAPHVMLFERPFVLTIDKLRLDRPGRIEERYLRAPNIHIDLGSWASTDMTYTLAADVYLGDVSSQIYEFLLRPRPCLFLNIQGTDYRDNPSYAHWRAGEVIEDVADLGASLRRAISTHGSYEPVQKEMFAASFDLSEDPSSVRAANAICGYLDSQFRRGEVRAVA
jgi:CDP-glycerol glycerophosphotransferase (TagB/SpsB family)